MHVTAMENERTQRTPARDRWTRLGAAGGIAFVVLQLISQILVQAGGAEPAFDAPAGEIVSFFMNRNISLALAGGFFHLLSAFAFLWFLGVLWAVLRQHEGEPAWLSQVAFASGVLGMAVLFFSGGWELALLRLQQGSPEIIQLLFDQGNQAFATLWMALAGLLLAAGIVTLRDGALPRWLGWYGLAVAGLLLLARTVWFSASGIKFMPYVLFWVWLVATSVILIRRAGSADG